MKKISRVYIIILTNFLQIPNYVNRRNRAKIAYRRAENCPCKHTEKPQKRGSGQPRAVSRKPAQKRRPAAGKQKKKTAEKAVILRAAAVHGCREYTSKPAPARAVVVPFNAVFERRPAAVRGWYILLYIAL